MGVKDRGDRTFGPGFWLPLPLSFARCIPDPLSPSLLLSMLRCTSSSFCPRLTCRRHPSVHELLPPLTRLPPFSAVGTGLALVLRYCAAFNKRAPPPARHISYLSSYVFLFCDRLRCSWTNQVCVALRFATRVPATAATCLHTRLSHCMAT